MEARNTNPDTPPALFHYGQIRFILLQNRQGKTRLSKWYIPPPSEQEKFRIESEIHKLIVSRDRKYTNFVEVRQSPPGLLMGPTPFTSDFQPSGCCPHPPLDPVIVLQYQSYKLIYRRYAGLYFSMGVDVTDNELAYLESIHLFVELLDEFFRNVCELDIVFNFNKVSHFL